MSSHYLSLTQTHYVEFSRGGEHSEMIANKLGTVLGFQIIGITFKDNQTSRSLQAAMCEEKCNRLHEKGDGEFGVGILLVKTYSHEISPGFLRTQMKNPAKNKILEHYH